MAIVNVMEQIVSDRLDVLLKNEECCTCERCIDDMKAIALNKLPPKYVSTNSGELFTKLNASLRQNTVDIDIAVTAALAMVSKQPSHLVENA